MFEGPLEPNNLLSNSEKIYENQLTGPEAIVVHNGKLCYGHVHLAMTFRQICSIIA